MASTLARFNTFRLFIGHILSKMCNCPCFNKGYMPQENYLWNIENVRREISDRLFLCQEIQYQYPDDGILININIFKKCEPFNPNRTTVLRKDVYNVFHRGMCKLKRNLITYRYECMERRFPFKSDVLKNVITDNQAPDISYSFYL